MSAFSKPARLNRGSIDMTLGNPMMQILRFSIPLLLGNILQQLYNTVDSMVVGNFVGSGALAAVGASGPVINLLVSFFLGISVGTGIVISQAYGAKDFERLQKAVGTVITVTILVALVLMAAGIPLSQLLLGGVACGHGGGQLDLLLTGQQGHLADLLEVHAHRVVDAKGVWR